tara:strand:- start:70 stop:483 length:414 start_codon:yes stop_codon:yes gene_type:complete
MLLSQQAELLSIESNIVVIELAPNWENMIRSRTVVIEDAVKKLLGEHMTISFKSKTNKINTEINKNKTADKEKDVQKKITNSNELKNIRYKTNNLQAQESNITANEKLSNNSTDKEKNSSKNLADFFNGQIIDSTEE